MSRFTDPTYFRRHSWVEYVFIFSVCFGQLLTQNSTTEAMMQQYDLESDFKAPSSEMAFFSSSLGLALGSLLLVSGRLGDVYGVKKMLVGGYIWITIWSLLGGISYYTRHLGPSFYICCRVFQGSGLACIVPNVFGAAGRIYSPNTFRKRIVFGLVGLCIPVGGFMGVWWSGIIGVRTHRWDWNYYAFAILSALVGIMTHLSTPSLPTQRNPDGSRQDPDWIGCFFLVASMVLIDFCWNEAAVVGWQKAYLIVLLPVSVLLMVVFAFWEIKYAKNPLLHRVVLRNWRLMSIMFMMMLGWGTYGINVFHTQVLYQQYRQYSTFAAGSAFAVVVPMGVIASVIGAILINHRTVELLMLGGMLCFLATSIILATTPIHQSYWGHSFGAWVCAPFALVWTAPTGSVILSEELPPQFQALAGTLVNVAINYGLSLFLGMFGTIETQLQKQQPENPIRAWRGAEFFAVGLSGLASIIALLLVINKFVLGTPPAGDEEKQIDIYPQKPADKAPRTDAGDEPKETGKRRDDGNCRRDSISSLSVKLSET